MTPGLFSRKTTWKTAALVTATISWLSWLQPACGMIHNLSINRDAREVFQIESFGFRAGGFMNLTVAGFSVSECVA